MKTTELRNKSIEELNAELLNLLKEQMSLRMQKAVGQLTQMHLFRKGKKQVARLKTIIGEKSK